MGVCAVQKGQDYGKQRLWSSIGWGALAYAAGRVIDVMGFTPAFIAHAGFAVPCLISGLLMWRRGQAGKQAECSNNSPPHTPWDDRTGAGSGEHGEDASHHLSPTMPIHGTAYIRERVPVPPAQQPAAAGSDLSAADAGAGHGSNGRSGPAERGKGPSGSSSGHDASVPGHSSHSHSHSSTSTHSHSASLIAMEEGGLMAAYGSQHGAADDMPVRKLDMEGDPHDPRVSPGPTGHAGLQRAMQWSSCKGMSGGAEAGSGRAVVLDEALLAERLEAEASYRKGYSRVGSQVSVRRRGANGSDTPDSCDDDPRGYTPRGARDVGQGTTHSPGSLPACSGGAKAAPPAGNGGAGVSGQPPVVAFRAAVAQLLASSPVWVFLARCCVLGFGTGAIGTCLFLFMSDLGSSHGLEGLMLMVRV